MSEHRMQMIQLETEQLADPKSALRKYEIIIDAEGADELQAPPGTEVCFVWKRKGNISFSESSEIWDETGVVYWDTGMQCHQVATLVQHPDGGWQPKICYLLVQAVSHDDEGLPSGLGDIIASTKIDLGDFCTEENEVDEDSEPRRVVLQLQPSGTLTVRVSVRWLRDWVPGPDDAPSEEASELSLTPASSSASLCPDDSTYSMDPGFATMPPSAAPSPLPMEKPGKALEAHSAAAGGGGAEQTEENTIHAAASYGGTCATPTSSELSSALMRSTSSGSGEESMSGLQRRCKRLSRERDEARAEAFAEASVAVQRGIEIDTLKRAKDVLLQRLETTERQLMMLMRIDSDSPSSQSISVSEGGKNAAGQGMMDTDGMIHALVEAKVALAEKEFEMMDLQGKVRAREAHIEALTDHLTAIRAATELERQTNATPVSLKSIRTRSVTPQTYGHGLSPKLSADNDTLGVEEKNSSPVLRIYAHAGLSQ